MSGQDPEQDEPSAAKLSGGAEGGIAEEGAEGMKLAMDGGGSIEPGGKGNRPNGPDASRH